MVCKFDKIEIESFSVIQLNVEKKKFKKILRHLKKKEAFFPHFRLISDATLLLIFFSCSPPSPPPLTLRRCGTCPGASTQ